MFPVTTPKHMKTICTLDWRFTMGKDAPGRDLIEYAMMAGFVAVAAGSFIPAAVLKIGIIFSMVGSSLVAGA
jgi:pilus assembly protein Flp/PilA